MKRNVALRAVGAAVEALREDESELTLPLQVPLRGFMYPPDLRPARS